MGADLFIQSLYQPNQARWEPQFEEAVRLRDSLPTGSPERQEAQNRVEDCYAQMRSQGYFRDPYNDWDLLWQFGLSWWSDVIPMLDDEDRLSVRDARRLLALLDEREHVFEERMSAVSDEDTQSFRSRYTELRQFLNQAVALGEPIDCSL
jgi:hypothetical protein